MNDREILLRALYDASVLLANVSGGSWEGQTHEWTTAANRWRRTYHEILLKEFNE